jgi:hypothetical protein
MQRQAGPDGVAARARGEVDLVTGWYDKFFESIIVISSLGSGFTFSVALTPVDETKIPSFTPDDVTTFVSLSWLFFTLALAVSITLRLAFTLYTDSLTRHLNSGTGRIFFFLYGALYLVQSLTFLGFFFASLSIAAFQDTVGYIAIGFTGLYMVLLYLFIHYKIFVCSTGSLCPYCSAD